MSFQPPLQAQRGEPRRAATLALLSFAMLIVSLDQYIVVVALPDIARDLGYSSQTLQSVISAYAVASSGFLLLGGRATDLLGQRRVLATGLALYAVASLAGGLATGPAVQLSARAAQGLGGALVFPSTLALINTTFAEGHARNRALGIWGGAGAAGLVIGVLRGAAARRSRRNQDSYVGDCGRNRVHSACRTQSAHCRRRGRQGCEHYPCRRCVKIWLVVIFNNPAQWRSSSASSMLMN